MFTGARGPYPLGCFFNYLLNNVELDYFPYVGLVVGSFKHSVLAVIFQTEKIKQLQPQIFKFVCIIFKKLEVVADCRQYFVEFRLQFTVVLSD